MPVDQNGEPLNVGDEVIVHCVVTGVFMTPNGPNVEMRVNGSCVAFAANSTHLLRMSPPAKAID